MDLRIQIVAIIVTGMLFLGVLELVRRRSLMERYALLWLFSSAVLLFLAAWRGALELFAGLIGIAYAPSALFVLAFGFILVLLLHFSLVISRLSDQNKVLAQRMGLLYEQLQNSEVLPAPVHQAAERPLGGLADADAPPAEGLLEDGRSHAAAMRAGR